MELINVLTSALTIWIVAVVALVPLAGLTARFGLKPVLDSVARLRAAGRGAHETDERYARLEEQIRGHRASIGGTWEEQRRVATLHCCGHAGFDRGAVHLHLHANRGKRQCARDRLQWFDCHTIGRAHRYQSGNVFVRG